MNDFDNMPAGVPPMDGVNAGVNRHDDPHIALSKLMTHELEQKNAKGRESLASAGASQFTNKTGSGNNPGNGAATAQGYSIYDEMPNIRLGNIMSVRHLTNITEGRRRTLVSEREKKLNSALRVRQMAWGVLIVAALIVILGIKIPFIPYRYLMVEYFTVRISLIASIIIIVKTSSSIAKAVTDEEKRLTVLGQAVIDAIKASWKEKFKTSRNHFSQDYLLGKFEAPRKDLTAKFLYELNKRILQKTGNPMPYAVYRFKLEKLWDRAFFLPFNGEIDEKIASLADHIPLEDLERLASQRA